MLQYIGVIQRDKFGITYSFIRGKVAELLLELAISADKNAAQVKNLDWQQSWTPSKSG